GIRRVEISTNAGKLWTDASLDNELGKYSWRRFRLNWTPPARGSYSIMARATNVNGVTQPTEQPWNKSGYQRNVIEKVNVTVA
ncbi:MAG: molybdopterin-dependent oxidoreductase, partial [Tepidisphaeraceae bacterium]